MRDKLYCSQAVLSLYEGVPMLELIGQQTTTASALLRDIGETRRDMETAKSLDYLKTIDLENLRERMELIEIQTAYIQTTRHCDT